MDAVTRARASAAAFAVALASVGGAVRPSGAAAQRPLNLGFEMASHLRRTDPWGWTTTWPELAPATRMRLDTVRRHEGRRSLRVTRSDAAEGSFRFTVVLDPAVLPLAGRHLRLAGWIRTEGVAGGQAALLLRTTGAAGGTYLDSMPGRGAVGTSGWTRYTLEARLDSAVRQVQVGGYVGGRGTAWFDALEVEIDGRRLDAHPAVGAPPTAADLRWLSRAAVPLGRVDPGGSSADLAALRDVLGNARVIGLGEATHGTSEFQRMKHRLTEYLAREAGVTVFAIETDQLQAERLNHYVRTGRGNSRLAMTGFYNLWQTREMLAFAEWARRYNTSGRARLEIVGFDMIDPRLAMDSTRRFLAAADPEYLPVADALYRELGDVWRREEFTYPDSVLTRWLGGARSVHAHLRARSAAYAGVADTTRVARAVQHANLVVQSVGNLFPANGGQVGYRDSCQAENLRWELSRRPPGTRVVISAHSNHVARLPNRMGTYLDRVFGDEYRVLGLATHQGTYSADTSAGRPIAARRYVPVALHPGPPGSLEGMLHTLGRPRLLLNLRAARDDPEGAGMLLRREMRLLPAFGDDWGFRPYPPAQLFDGVVFIGRTGATRMLPCPRGLVCGG